jgi:hypothetical protein
VFRVRAARLLTACSALALLASGVSGAAGLGCGSSAATTILVPITGVTVRAESITGGLGCGRGSTQIFKYAVVVFGPNPMAIGALGSFDTPLASNVFDCFSDGLFVNLPATAGSTDYKLSVYAYSAQAYEAATDAKIRAALAGTDAATLAATSPTFTTTCSATEIPDVQSLAACQPLVAGAGGVGAPVMPATVTLSAASFAAGDGGTATCDIHYATVRYRAKPSQGDAGAITDVACGQVPATGIAITPVVAPTTYTIEVALLRADGNAFGQTTCSADTSPGLISSAVCRPLP